MPRLTTIHRTEAHEQGVWSATWIPNSSKLMTGSVDESVKVWEESPDAFKFVHNYQGHTLGVISVVVNSTGEVGSAGEGFGGRDGVLRGLVRSVSA